MERKDYYLPESNHLLTFRRPAAVALYLQASGTGAADHIRQICAGHLPRVGERYVYVCTATQTDGDAVSVSFQLVPLEEDGDGRATQSH